MSGDGPFTDPGIPDGERTVYRGVVGGEPAGEGELRVEAGDDHYIQRVAARLDAGYGADLCLRWLRRRDSLLADTYALTTQDGEKRVSREEGNFRDVRALGWGGEIERYPRNVTPLLGAALALRGMEFTPGARHEFAVWLANSIWWTAEAEVERREDARVPAGALDAWRVRVRPSLEQVSGGLDKLVGPLLPPLTLHFAAEAPHRFLRFSFPTGPFPWNPRGVIEATALD